MEDNIDHTIPTSDVKDLNTFKYEKGYARGCSTGQHDWSVADAQISVGDNGLTALRVKCILCGVVGEIQAPLNVNDLIEKYNGDGTVMTNHPQPLVQPVPSQPSQPVQPVGIEPIKPVINDNFWEQIKKGM